MSGVCFVFDLDSTLTCLETLPFLAQNLGNTDLSADTHAAVQGDVPFDRSFPPRVQALAAYPIGQIRALMDTVPLEPVFVDFIARHRDCCYLATGNLDVWIAGIVERLGLQGHVCCSRGNISGGHLTGVLEIADKAAFVQGLQGTVVVIGDGAGDIPMAQAASLAVGYAGVHPLPERFRLLCDAVFESAAPCAAFLESLFIS